MASDAEILRQAQATLAQAINELYPGLPIARESIYNLLGLVWGENKFGTTGDWQGSNNWGSVRCYRQDYGCVQHGDRDAGGNPVTVPFQRYPSQLEGAKGFLRTILKTQAERDAVASGSASDLSSAMYAAHYYTGTTGTDEQRIASYANLIRRGANTVKAALGSAASSFAPAQPEVSKTGLLLGALALGTGIWYLYPFKRKSRRVGRR